MGSRAWIASGLHRDRKREGHVHHGSPRSLRGLRRRTLTSASRVDLGLLATAGREPPTLSGHGPSVGFEFDSIAHHDRRRLRIRCRGQPEDCPTYHPDQLDHSRALTKVSATVSERATSWRSSTKARRGQQRSHAPVFLKVPVDVLGVEVTMPHRQRRSTAAPHRASPSVDAEPPQGGSRTRHVSFGHRTRRRSGWNGRTSGGA